MMFTKSLMVAAMAFGILAQGAVAYADQGILVMPANPVVAQTMIGGGGEQYPAFANNGTPVVSERMMANNGGQNYPAFANPNNGGTRADYAAIGTVNGSTNVQYAGLTGFNHNGG
jgi:hypothetical protein